jgi:hypothetical protein
MGRMEPLLKGVAALVVDQVVLARLAPTGPV